MKSPILGLRVAGVVFGLICLAQLTRLLVQFEVLVYGYELPLWPSMITGFVFGGLCIWMWGLACILTK